MSEEDEWMAANKATARLIIHYWSGEKTENYWGAQKIAALDDNDFNTLSTMRMKYTTSTLWSALPGMYAYQRIPAYTSVD